MATDNKDWLAMIGWLKAQKNEWADMALHHIVISGDRLERMLEAEQEAHDLSKICEQQTEILKHDSALLSFLEEHKQYVLGFAPSGKWSAFDMHNDKTCYGKTLRECLETLQVMHNDINT